MGESTKTLSGLKINEIVLAAPDIDSNNFETLAEGQKPLWWTASLFMRLRTMSR